MRKYLPLFVMGGLMDLALAPFYLFPVLLISFPVFYTWLKKAYTPRHAFWCGWWFGFGYFVFGLYWISNSLLVDLSFAWLIPFAVCLIPAAAAIYTGLVSYLFKKMNIDNPGLFAVLWVLAEFARGYFPFGGFPWNNIGYSALVSIYSAQIASIGGVYFVGLVIIITAMLPVYRNKLAVALLPIACVAYGFVSVEDTKYSNLTATIIQPNIQQTLKWDPARMRDNFFNTLTLAANARSDFVIWPESSVPYPIERDPQVKAMIAAVTPQNGLTIASSTRVQGNFERIWNSMYVLDAQQNIVGVYDKHHLVPFGEYVPFRSVLPIDKITPGMVDFSAGSEGKVITTAKAKFLPLICYEIIFPQYADGDYDFIVNITNDAWFGDSTGPRQHLSMVQMRAIEQGVPVLRAANTGISAVIDSYGRVLKKIPYNEKGIIASKIPLKSRTIYSQFGNLIFLFSCICSIMVLTLRARRVRKIVTS